MSAVSSSSPFRIAGLTMGHAFWTLIAGFVVPSLVIYGALRLLIGANLVDVELLQHPEWMIVLFAVQYAVGLLTVLVLPKYIQKMSTQKLRELFGIMRRPTFADLGRALMYFVGYILVTIVVLQVVKILIPGLDLDQKQEIGFDNLTDATGLIAAFISLVILAPIAEELIFRGYLFGSLRPIAGAVSATVITSALFGLVHGQWNVAIDVAVLSAFMCVLRMKTGSIWSGIFMHMTKNALAYFFLFVAPLIGLQIQ